MPREPIGPIDNSANIVRKTLTAMIDHWQVFLIMICEQIFKEEKDEEAHVINDPIYGQ